MVKGQEGSRKRIFYFLKMLIPAAETELSGLWFCPFLNGAKNVAELRKKTINSRRFQLWLRHEEKLQTANI